MKRGQPCQWGPVKKKPRLTQNFRGISYFVCAVLKNQLSFSDFQSLSQVNKEIQKYTGQALKRWKVYHSAILKINSQVFRLGTRWTTKLSVIDLSKAMTKTPVIPTVLGQLPLPVITFLGGLESVVSLPFVPTPGPLASGRECWEISLMDVDAPITIFYSGKQWVVAMRYKTHKTVGFIPQRHANLSMFWFQDNTTTWRHTNAWYDSIPLWHGLQKSSGLFSEDCCTFFHTLVTTGSVSTPCQKVKFSLC